MAGKIPQRFIDDLLDRVDIVDVIGARLDLRKTGKNHSARCPFHDEKTPSFSVNPEKQFYYCFGCSAGGNAIGFVMDYDRVDFLQAVETLANLTGLEVPKESPSNPRQDAFRKGLYTALDQADRFYRQQLRQHPTAEAATQYLRERGLSGEIARDFAIGYAPPGWDNLLLTAGDDAEQINRLVTAGLIVVKEEDQKTYDRFRHRIMFPIRDTRGRTIAFGGRVLGDDKPKYLNSPETPVFHKSRELYGLYEANRANKHLDNLLVVEGYMDVVVLAQHGITNAVATLGTATSAEHLDKLYRYVDEVVFCFDGDSAGRKAAYRAMEICLPAMQDGRGAKFLFLPEGEDPDTQVRQSGAGVFRTMIDKATPLSTFLFDSVSAGLDLELPDDRAKLSQQAAPLINRIPSGVFQQLMLDQLSQKTGLTSDTLRHLVMTAPPTSTADEHIQPADYDTMFYDKAYADEAPYPEHADPATLGPANRSAGEQRRSPTTPTDSRKKVRRPPVQWLIALLAHHPQLAKEFDPEDIATLSTLELADMPLLLEVLKVLQENPDYTLNHLLGYWRGINGAEQGEWLAQIVSTDLATAPGYSEQTVRQQAHDIVGGLLRIAEQTLPAEQQISRLANKPRLDDEDRKQALVLWQRLTAENADAKLITDIKQLLAGKGRPDK